MSRRTNISLFKPRYRSILSGDTPHELPLQHQPSFRKRLPPPPTRHFSSSTSTASKPIVLEKPDKFRPPSHAARLNARRVPRQYPGSPIPKAEQEAQATRKYPHTFPNEGTRMHWFLTNKYIHLWISLGTLFTLSIITLTQSFLHTSPFAHLTPSISTLYTAPFGFVRDWVSVIRMHQEYTSARTAESRRNGIADAQKRRLYRRAHGMEDVEKEGVGEGVDVRGLVSWDDGLTRGERERLVEKVREAVGGGVGGEDEDDAGPVGLGEEFGEEGRVEEPRRERRPVKKWLGIW